MSAGTEAGGDDEDLDLVPTKGLGAGVGASKPAKAASIAGEKSIAVPLAEAAKKEKKTQTWGIPPIQWRALLGLNYGVSSGSSGGQQASLGRQLSISGSSYVLAPWFARVNGGLNFNENISASQGRTSSASGVFGNAAAMLFPVSRFPASLNWNRGTSQAKSDDGGAVVMSQGISLSQQYRPLDTSYNLSGSYALNTMRSDPRVVTAGSVSTSTASERYSMNYGLPIPGDNPANFSLSSSVSNNRSGPSGAKNDYGTIDANHSIYLEDYVMTIRTDAGIVNSIVRETNNASQARVVQVGGNMDWVPSDDYPLRLSGTWRALYAGTVFGSSVAETAAANLGMNAIYPLNKHWSLSGGVSGGRNQFSTKSDGVTAPARVSANAQANAGVGWQGEGAQRKWGAFDYNIGYGSGATVSWTQIDSVSQANAGWTVSGSQGLSLVTRLGDGRTSSWTIGQGLGMSINSGGDPTFSISHNLGMSRQLVQTGDSQLGWQASFTDSRSIAETTSYSQALSSSLFGSVLTGPNTSLNSSLVAAMTRQGSSSSQGAEAEWIGSVGGQAAFTNARFANVPGLNYSASYSVSGTPGGAPSGSQSGSGGFVYDHSFQQNWSWRAGRLGLQVQNAYTFKERQWTSSWFFFVTRDFSGML